jgi:hypothetical protein
LFGQFAEKYRSITYFWVTYFLHALILKKLCWATLWAIVSQTHPVTLVVNRVIVSPASGSRLQTGRPDVYHPKCSPTHFFAQISK